MDNFSTHGPSDIPRLSMERLFELGSNMGHIFSPTELNTFDEDTDKISLASRMCNSKFWEFAAGEKTHTKYTEAVSYYLEKHWSCAHFPEFEEFFTELVHSFHKYRGNSACVRDLLVLFLHENLSHMKALYILDQPCNLDASPTKEGIDLCISTFDWTLPRNTNLSQWILEKWLPFHFKYFYGQAEAKRKDEDERRSRGARRNKPSEPADDMEP